MGRGMASTIKFIMVVLIVSFSFSTVVPAGTARVTSTCVELAAQKFKVPLSLVWGILAVENGRVGKISKKNENGTYDIGPMQINSKWLKTFEKMGVCEEMILNDPRINIFAGAWILSQCLVENNNYFGVGSYHSLTQKYQIPYLKKLGKTMSNLDVNKLLKRINED